MCAILDDLKINMQLFGAVERTPFQNCNAKQMENVLMWEIQMLFERSNKTERDEITHYTHIHGNGRKPTKLCFYDAC